jgi:hypothetical protein
MPEQVSYKELFLWIDSETQPLDMVASWETLNAIYETLGFKDIILDNDRLDEYKYIIAESNKFLTRVKKKLEATKTLDGMIAVLQNDISVTDTRGLKSRESLAYHKLRQQWLRQAIQQLSVLERTDDE